MVPAVVCGVSGAGAVCVCAGRVLGAGAGTGAVAAMGTTVCEGAIGAVASANAVTAQAPGKQILAWIGIDGSLAINACQRRACALDEGGKRNHSERYGNHHINCSPRQFGGESGITFITADERCG